MSTIDVRPEYDQPILLDSHHYRPDAAAYLDRAQYSSSNSHLPFPTLHSRAMTLFPVLPPFHSAFPDSVSPVLRDQGWWTDNFEKGSGGTNNHSTHESKQGHWFFFLFFRSVLCSVKCTGLYFKDVLWAEYLEVASMLTITSIGTSGWYLAPAHFVSPYVVYNSEAIRIWVLRDGVVYSAVWSWGYAIMLLISTFRRVV